MIRREEFRQLRFKIERSISKSFNKAKNNSDFVLLLCDAHYSEKLKGTNTNPYVINPFEDGYFDRERVKILLDYAKHQYSFLDKENTSDSKSFITIELMIYTHLWESKPFLRMLRNLLNLCEGKRYDWNIKVPDFKKYKFIIEIKDGFKDLNMGINNIIDNSFHPSLRNAFAHSEYAFNRHSPKIELLNYKDKDKSWALKEITFDDWTQRFCNSFLMNCEIMKQIDNAKKSINKERILLRKDNGKEFQKLISYDGERDLFILE